MQSDTARGQILSGSFMQFVRSGVITRNRRVRALAPSHACSCFSARSLALQPRVHSNSHSLPMNIRESLFGNHSCYWTSESYLLQRHPGLGRLLSGDNMHQAQVDATNLLSIELDRLVHAEQHLQRSVNELKAANEESPDPVYREAIGVRVRTVPVDVWLLA